MLLRELYIKVREIFTNLSRNKELIRFCQFFLIVLVLCDIVLLTLIIFVPVSAQFKWYILIFDLIVVLILILEFILRFRNSDDKRNFLWENGIDVLGMIPEIIIGPYVSAFSYLRLIRVIKILSLFKMQIEKILSFLHKSKIDYGIFVVGIVLVSGAILFYIIEEAVNPDINSFTDSLWYLVVSITTVGYGDITPVTKVGRFIATLIIVIGIGFVSFFTAIITSRFVKGDADEKQLEIDSLNQKIEDMQLEMKKEMNELKKLIKEK